MFNYFGYGSNMSMTSLQAKGVCPISSQPALLKGWRLRFNVQHFFRHEGGVANIEYTGNQQDYVLGILHQCHDHDLPPLDATEAYGYGYDRISIEVNTLASSAELAQFDSLDVLLAETQTQAQAISALTYIGMPSFINHDCLPSQRYLNILIDGSTAAKLPNFYMKKLRQQAVHPARSYPEYQAPQGNYPTFNVDSLATKPLYTALYGHVFDMSKARVQHEYLKQYFGGKDMTLFHLKRLDSANNQETLDDIKHQQLNCAQRAYLNSFLHEYAVEYRYVGHFTYHHD